VPLLPSRALVSERTSKHRDPRVTTSERTGARRAGRCTGVREHPGLSAAAVVVGSRGAGPLANTRPGFDPTAGSCGSSDPALALNTNGAPSWKPLPYLLTCVRDHGSLRDVAVDGDSGRVSLSGVVFAARIAYRLTSSSPERRYAAIAAARSRARAAGNPRLLALHPERPVGSNDRVVVPRRDRLPLSAGIAGDRARRACGTREPECAF